MADLISLDDYKTLEGIKSSDKDEKFELLISSVSKLARTYCGTEFDAYLGSPGKTEVFDVQWDTHVVQLEESPVTNVQGVFERSSQSETYTELFSDGTNDKYEWYFDSITDSIIRTNENGSYRCWPRGTASVKIIYSAGYASIPQDLQLAIADMITYYSNNEHKQNQAIGSSSREGNPTSTLRNDTGFPDHIRRVLDLYRGI